MAETEVVNERKEVPELRHIINTPDRACPPGYKRDRYGVCRKISTGGKTMPIERNGGGHGSDFFNRLTHQIQHLTGNKSGEDCDDKDKDLIVCPNNRFGCTTKSTPAEIGKHQSDCYYRRIRCSWHLQCGKHEIRLSEYRKHLEDVHRRYIKKIGLNEEDEIVVKGDSMVRTCNIVRIDGTSDYFSRRFLLDLHEDILLICVHYIGEAEEANDYIYTLRINQGFHHAKYMRTSFCLPYVENSSSCVTSPNCTVLIPSKVFLNKDYLREIHYSLTIKRIY